MTTNLPATRLSAAIAAAKKLPAHTGAVAANAARRAGRMLAILADVSISMAEVVPGRGRRIDILREALGAVVADAGATVIAFSNLPREVTLDQLPAPGGSTALHLAIRMAAERRSERLLVISDGEPDDERAALAAAAAFGGPIDVIYCGDDAGPGRAFMAQLAAASGGRIVTGRFEQGPAALADHVRRLALAGPK